MPNRTPGMRWPIYGHALSTWRPDDELLHVWIKVNF
jgi:hypothetical protein